MTRQYFLGLAAAVAIIPGLAGDAFAQTTRLTPQAEEWQKKNPDRKVAKFTIPGQKDTFVYEGGYEHEGVDLEAQQVTNIQKDQVYDKAEKWVAEWNKNPDNQFIRFAGIEYLGGKEGKTWEDKGKKNGCRRYHKFGGIGRASILIYP